jgi:hypothetical protein
VATCPSCSLIIKVSENVTWSWMIFCHPNFK